MTFLNKVLQKGGSVVLAVLLVLSLVPFNSTNAITITDDDWEQVGSFNGVNGQVKDMATDSQGNIYVVGSFTHAGGVEVNRVAKWNGSAWSALGSGADNNIESVAIDSSDNVYITGSFTTVGGSSIVRVAKWNGSTWSAMGTGLNSTGYAIEVDSSDNVYVGGQFTTAGGVSVSKFAKWNGSAWSNIGGISGGLGYVYAIGIDSSDNVYVGGHFTFANGNSASNIAKWNGSAWSALGSGLGGIVNDIAIDSSDNVFPTGVFTTAGGSSANRVAKWNGSTWSALSTGLGGNGEAILLDASNNVYVAGWFTTAGGNAANYVAKWNGSAWSAMAEGLNEKGYALTLNGSNIIVGGQFSSAGQIGMGNLASWNGSSWNLAFNSTGFNDAVHSVVEDSEGNVYVGGNFKYFSSTAVNYIAKWNGSAWSAVGSGLNGRVRDIYIDNSDNVYVVGDFTEAGGSSANRVAKWNGSSWSALGSGLNGNTYSIDGDSSGNLYVGGTFSQAGGNAASYVAKWNGSTWSAVGSGADFFVYSVAVDSSDNLYIGGPFFNVGGAANFAKWNGAAWSAVGAGGVNGEVTDIFIDDSDNVYITGAFSSAGGNSAEKIAKWDGSTWSSFGSGLTHPNWSVVGSVTVDSAGNVYAGGTFTSAGGNAASNIAVWDGSAWSAMGSGADGHVDALAYTSSRLYAGGEFTSIGGESAGKLAYISLNTAPTLTSLSATAATDGTGTVAISAVVDDADDNALSVSYRYSSGACVAYNDQATTTLASATTATYGSYTTDNEDEEGYQLSSVTTASGANTLGVTWNSKTDVPTANGTYCIYAFANDGTVSGSVATTTVTVDNITPNVPTSPTASLIAEKSIKVSWNANGNESGTVYQVYNNTTGAIVKTVTTTYAHVTGLSAGTSYTFKVRAQSTIDDSVYSSYTANTSAVTTPVAASQSVTDTVTSEEIGVPLPVQVQAGSQTISHTVTVSEISDEGEVTMTIESNPVTVTLSEGESQNIDTDGNGQNDLTVTMNSVGEGTFNFTLTAIFSSGGGTFVGSSPIIPANGSTTKAIQINAGAASTNDKNVTLTITAENATQMAISNNANFEGTSYMPYSKTTNWTLTPGNGQKMVFVKLRSADGGTIVVSDYITLSGESFDDTTPTPTPDGSCTLTPEHAYKSSNSPAVYYITTDCTKRAFTKSAIYFTYFTSWSDVTVTTDAKITSIPDDSLGFMPAGPLYDPQYGALVKITSDPKVYLLLNDEKYWITDETVFNALNYKWDWIEDIDERLLNKYKTGEEITDTDRHPHYTLVKYKDNVKVYRLEPKEDDSSMTVKRHIANETVFKELGFRFDRIVTIPDTEVYDDGPVLDSVE